MALITSVSSAVLYFRIASPPFSHPWAFACSPDSRPISHGASRRVGRAESSVLGAAAGASPGPFPLGGFGWDCGSADVEGEQRCGYLYWMEVVGDLYANQGLPSPVIPQATDGWVGRT